MAPSPSTKPHAAGSSDAIDASRRWLFAGSSTAMAVVDRDGCIVEVNDALLRLFRQPADDFVGRPLLDVAAPRDIELTRRWLADCAAGDVHPIAVESEMGGESGRPRWFTTEGHAIVDADGEVEAYILTIVESTATRLLHGALVTAHADRASLVAHAPIAVVEVGEGDLVTTWNPSAEALFGRPHQDAVGRPLTEVGFEGSPSLRARAPPVPTWPPSAPPRPGPTAGPSS